MVLTTLKYANMALAFFLELGVLFALSYWGFQAGPGTIGQIILGLGAPIVAIVVWGIFGAPRSARRLSGPWFLLLRIVFFGAGVVALLAASQLIPGLIFGLAVAINLSLIYLWAQ